MAVQHLAVQLRFAGAVPGLPDGQFFSPSSPSLNPGAYHSKDFTLAEPAAQGVHTAMARFFPVNHSCAVAPLGMEYNLRTAFSGGADNFQAWLA